MGEKTVDSRVRWNCLCLRSGGSALPFLALEMEFAVNNAMSAFFMIWRRDLVLNSVGSCLKHICYADEKSKTKESAVWARLLGICSKSRVSREISTLLTCWNRSASESSFLFITDDTGIVQKIGMNYDCVHVAWVHDVCNIICEEHTVWLTSFTCHKLQSHHTAKEKSNFLASMPCVMRASVFWMCSAWRR